MDVVDIIIMVVINYIISNKFEGVFHIWLYRDERDDFLDWDDTDSHTGELIITYNNKIGNNILCLRTFYVLYVKLNQEDNGHLV